MNVLWLSCNTTALDPSIASFTEVSLYRQVDGVCDETITTYKIRPLLIEEDRMPPGKLPAGVCTYSRNGEDLFHYSTDTLMHDGVSPETLFCKGRISPARFVAELSELLTPHKWVVAGHAISFFLHLLPTWEKRVGYNVSPLLRSDLFIDTKESALLIKAFNQNFPLSLLGLAAVVQVPYGKDSASKLSVIKTFADRLASV